MTKRRIVAGIDSSTQSCKVVRVDAETGEILGTQSAPHPDGTSIDPARWWEALEQAGGTRLDDVEAVSVSAQQHGMVALDDDDRPVHDALLWNDVRSAPQADALREHFGADFWAREIGVVPVSSFTITKLAWLAENHPELAGRVRRVMLPHDWLSWRLGGQAHAPVTDRSDASGTGYYSVPENRYRTELLEHAFGRVPELPRIIGPSEVAGTTPSGCLIGAGCGDNAGAALGLGLAPGEVVVSVGTSGAVFASTDRNIADPSGAIAGFADATGRNLPLLATINGARILSSNADLLGVDLAEFDRLASSGAPDAGGLTMVPYFDGERTPNLPHATGSLVGMTRAQLTRENLARSAVLGLLCVLADALDALRATGVAVERVLLIGGGSKSASLREAAADIFRAEILIPQAGEYVALGAARQAAWALSGSQEPPVWERHVERILEPSASPEWAQTVRGRFADARLNIYSA
ncbi:xylulose kinase (plasmid) [Arthrobacter sp. ERGS1:01]|uniref:xylulokinase n=1 Tax=Arthrobacter sp. ERGS1:01 TaxID=1704044 RepID=UPI0006B423AB|nr:xylulokinase [Arthrobacter sp. ERGS1:01]ALE04176.1 xylulose kinase [Arthrobacter sp. ERGS1:01]